MNKEDSKLLNNIVINLQNENNQRLTNYHIYVSNLTEVNSFHDLCNETLNFVENNFDFTYFNILRVVGNKLRTIAYRGFRSAQPLQYNFDENGIATIFNRIHVDDLARLEGGDRLDGPGICVRAVNTRSVQYVHDVRTDPDYIEAPYVREILYPTRSELVVPILIERTPIGVLNIESDKVDYYSKNDRMLLESIARHFSSSYSLLKYQTQLRELQDFANNFSEIHTLHELVKLTLRSIQSIFEVSICDFMLLIDDRLRSVGVIGLRPPENNPLEYDEAGVARSFFKQTNGSKPEGGFKLNTKSITVRAFNTMNSQLINDVRKNPDYSEYSSTVVGDAKLNTLSELAVPIIVNGISLGVLNLESQNLDAFSHKDRELVESIAKLVATAIIRINLERENEEDIYQTIIESSIEGVGLLHDNMYIYVNQGLVKSLGYDSPKDIVGKPQSMFMKKENTKPTDHISMDNILVGTHQGRKCYLEVKSNNIIFQNQECVIEFYRDITTKRLMEKELAQQEEQIKKLLERYNTISNNLHLHASKLAKAFDLPEIVEITKETITNVFGFERVGLGLVENNDLKFVLLHQPEKFRVIPIDGPGITTRAVRTKKVQLVNDTARDPDYISLRSDGQSGSELVVPIFINERLVGVIDVATEKPNAFNEQDVKLVQIFSNHIASALIRSYTVQLEEEIKQQNEVLQKQNKQLKELDQLKSNFIVTATHELRTPVTSILGYADFMLTSGMAISDEQKQDLEVIFRNSQRLARLTDDLLDIQRIQTGRLSLNIKLFDIVSTVQQVQNEIIPLFNDKQQRLNITLPDSLMIEGDSNRIHQLLINLLSNSNKFTPDGGKIDLEVSQDQDSAIFKITDSGIGIDEEDIDKLFSPFPGINHGLNVKSTGLGLSICKGIVELHHGTIKAFSKGKGMGTTFTFRLPLKCQKSNSDFDHQSSNIT